MKIVQFISSAGYVGAERSFVELCNELSKKDEVYAVVVKECVFEERFDDSVKVLRLNSSSGRSNPFLYLELFSILRQIEPDIVHTHSSKATVIAYRLWRVMGFDFVATKRNMRRDPIFDKVPHPVAVSKEVASIIKNPEVRIVHNGLTLGSVPDQSLENKFTILAVGALRKIKGFDGLIEAFAGLGDDVVLWIAGEGEERKRLEEIAKKVGVVDRVLFLGYREDVPVLMKRAHLQVVNSISEGFGRVIVEALHHSNMLLSSEVGVATEVLAKELLFKKGSLKERLRDVYEHYDSYRKIFLECKAANADSFTVEEMTKNYRDLYNSIAGTRSGERVSG